MRNPIASAALVLLSLCLVAVNPRSAAAETALGTSTWSLELGTDLGAGNNDFSFAVRRHSGATSAFRVGIEMDLTDDDGDGTRTTTGSPDEEVAQRFSFGEKSLSIQWMRFAAIRDNVTATFALGPIVRMVRQDQNQEFRIGTASFNGFEFSQKRTTYGLSLGLGVEWFFNPRFSLGGQSGIRATTGTSEQVQIGRSGTGPTYAKTETNIESDVTELSTDEIRIQLTGYF